MAVTNLCAVVLFLTAIQTSSSTDPEIVLSQVIYRHGDRSPNNGVNAYPKNPVPESVWPQGLNQLTPRGMNQMYNLGLFLRNRYILGRPYCLLSEYYLANQIYVLSSDTDRTLQSAELTLAAMYPPSGDQIWKRGFKWQPIPVHTVPAAEDIVLNQDSYCPTYNRIYEEVVNSPDVLQNEADNKVFYEFIHNVTGLENVSIDNVWQIADILYVQSAHNIPLPSWATNQTWDNGTIPTFYKLLLLLNLTIDVQLTRLNESRYKGGPLVALILKNMKDKAIASYNGTIRHFAYSTHGHVMTAFFSLLDLYNGVPAPYGAAILVDLLRSGNEYLVEMNYVYNTTTYETHRLDLPGCTPTCTLDLFTTLVQDKFPADWNEECGLESPDSAVAGPPAV